MAMACAGLAYAQLQEIDIGIDPKFSSNDLRTKMEEEGKEFLRPEELLNQRFHQWREKLLETVAEGRDPDDEPWIAQFDLMDDSHTQYDD